MEKLIKNIDDNINFYESINYSISSMPDTLYYPGNIASIIFSAIENRLKTLRFAVENKFISDAYVLIRMIYEDILTFIYIEAKMNGKYEDKIVQQWILGKEKLHDLKMNDLVKFLTKNHKIKECFNVLDVACKYKDIKQYCNDYVHNNYLKNLILNTNTHVDCVTQEKHYNRIATYLEALKTLLLASLCILKPHYAMSSDYIDHLEMGLSPPQDSQYWVAPFMQEEFDKLYKSNKKVAELILKYSYMKFEKNKT